MKPPRVIEPETFFAFSDKPYFELGYRREYVDSTPAYPHLWRDVVDSYRSIEANLAQDGLGITCKPYFFLPSNEHKTRTNGWATVDWHYYDDDEERGDPWVGQVILNAKRTPIHPVMTDYMVAHEYSHHLQYHCWRYYDPEYNELIDDEKLVEYCQLRGISSDDHVVKCHYGPGEHHRHAMEIMANDARIMILDKHPDFFPHPVKHPRHINRSTYAKIEAWFLEGLENPIK